MTTEAKIREAFEKYKASKIYPASVAYGYFRAGYLSLLNELEVTGSLISGDEHAKFGEKAEVYDGINDPNKYWENRGYELIPLYRLPEGVEKP